MDEDLVNTVLARADVRKALSVAFKPHQDDLERLITLLNLTGSRSVLEFGSGWSTLVMALWANRHEAFVESLEADPLWYASTYRALEVMRNIAPRLANGDRHIRMYRTKEFAENERHRLLFSPFASYKNPNVGSFIYSCLSSPDFIYVDGPALQGRRIIVGNICDLDKSRPMAFLVDGRWPQAWEIRKTFPDYTALINIQISFICHSKFAEAIEWFKSTVDCIENPVGVELEE